MSDPVAIVRGALEGRDAWLVGGVVRDELLGRTSTDVDVAVAGDPEAAATAIARAAGRGTARFTLSDAFGAHRVVGPGRAWQADVSVLQGADIAQDLRRRDLTVNAIARPVAGGELLDPTGGRADLEAGVARMVSEQALADDPLRTLRVVRFATTLGLTVEPGTADAVRRHAPQLAGMAGERVFADLRPIIAARDPRAGLELADALGVLGAVLPELCALRAVPQNRFHHLDVWGHTLEVLDRVVDIREAFGAEQATGIDAVLREPLADDLDREGALRLGALLHDIAKPATRVIGDDGRTLGFPGHAEDGVGVTRDILRRLRASERLQNHVGALTRHHLALGFLTHHAPLQPADLYRYLTATEPVEVDVTLLSVADRLATRGDNAERSIARHMAMAEEVLTGALRWRAGESRPVALVRGDELADALGLEKGPELGRLLAALAQAGFTGEVTTREQAIAHARALLGDGGDR